MPPNAPPPPLTIHLEHSAQNRSYHVYFRSLVDVPHLMQHAGLRQGPCLIVTDAHVGPLYAGPLASCLQASGWTPHTIVLPPGEATKHPTHLQTIYDQALALNIDRKTPLLALGGGVVGDLAGFAAATLLRGIPFVQLPTTLMAQVDSALGGKTGLNHPTGKNLVGAFYQPRLVCADRSTLHTLPEREWTSGLAEVVKHALIADAGFFDFLERQWPDMLRREVEMMNPMVVRAAAVKAEVVSKDEQEQGLRAILNFGHTFAHAIEKATGYGTFTHGEAVAKGMLAALHLSQSLTPTFDSSRAIALVAQIPVAAPLSGIPIERLIEAMQTDKKRTATTLRYVLLDRIGHAYVTDQVHPDQMKAAWHTIIA